MEAILQYMLDLGAQVFLPIIIFIMGLIFKQKIGKAFKSGLLIGVGFVGINLVLDLLVSNLGPAAKQMIDNFGISLNIIDVGWPASAAIAYGTKVGAFVIPIVLLVNVIMIFLKLTKTLNVDIWNYWHFAFTGSLVAAATNSLTWGLVTAGLNAAIVLILADWTAPLVQKFYDIPNISFPHGFSAAYVPIAIPLNSMIDKIPVIKDIEIDPDTIQDRFGVFGEPIFMGLLLGIVVGMLAQYSVAQTLNLGVTMAAVMLLFPRVVKVLMEGLTPLSESAKSYMREKFEDREFYIGLDSAIAIGHPSAIATALILVPLTIFLAVIIPGNSVLPFGDLATLPFMIVMIIPITKGNIFRSTLIGSIIIGAGLLIATNLAPMITAAAKTTSFEFPEGANIISSICDGGNPLTWLIVKFMNLGIFGVGLILIGILGFGYYVRKNMNTA